MGESNRWDIITKTIPILGLGVAIILLLLRIQGDVTANSQKIADVQVDTTKSIERGFSAVNERFSEVNNSIAKLTVATIEEVFTNRQGIQDLDYRLTTVEERNP